MPDGTISTSSVKRSTILGIVISAVFAVLLFRILIIQTVNFDKYQSKVINQMTTESPVPANRGKIYDKNGNILATNITTYRIFISPSSISTAQQNAAEEEKSVAYAELISKGLSEILAVNYDDIYKQATQYTQYLDRTIKRKVDEVTADKVSEFITKNALEDMVYMEAQSTRYYPGDTLGAHIIGFTSSDGAGLYGLELQYNKYLKGVDGYYIKARDSYGNEMPYEYASYIEAINGYNLNTTIDTTVQHFLEEQLEKTVADHEAKNRACGIVMDVKTGAILAMATSSPFDLNDPWKLDEASQETLKNSGYAEESDEYQNLSRDLLTARWSNKAVTESYIPGSTFKIITSSMALEERVVKLTDALHCGGSSIVADRRIHCHKREGHGQLTFPEGLQQSCNVWFMELGKRVGIEKYSTYVKAFGYKEKTGIDLPGEGNSIFTSKMSNLDLAIYAFGQNFNVTPIQQICAVSAVANGGKLVEPYLVDQITDDAGNIIYQHETTVKRQVVSEDICKVVSQMLEDGVSGNGGAKNAYVAGYRVAAKTGTSEKKDAGKDGMYICSTVAYAPADDPEIAIIIIVDEPTKGVLYGSTVAAPYIADALENILPHMGVEAKYTQKELENMAITIGNYRGWSVSAAKKSIEGKGLRCEIVGEYTEKSTIKSQFPPSGTLMEKASGRVVICVGSATPDTVIVPDLTGRPAIAVNELLAGLGLNIKIEGTPAYLSGTSAVAYSQSVPVGTQVPKGTVITVNFRSMDGDEDPIYDR